MWAKLNHTRRRIGFSTIYKLVLKYYIAKPPTLCRDEKADIKVKSLKSLWRDEEGIWNLDGKGNNGATTIAGHKRFCKSFLTKIIHSAEEAKWKDNEGKPDGGRKAEETPYLPKVQAEAEVRKISLVF